IRAAIGASRGALLRQLGIECLLVASIGGALALLVELWAVRGLRTVLPPGIPRVDELRVDAGVGLFTLGATLVAALLSAIAPALLASRESINETIKEGKAQARAKSWHEAVRQGLVVGEIALAMILLVGATLAVRSFAKILRVNSGF